MRHPVDRIISDFHYRRSGAYLVEIKQRNPQVITPDIDFNSKIDSNYDIDTLTLMLILNDLDLKYGNMAQELILLRKKQKNPEVISPHIHMNNKIDNDSDIDTI